MSDDPTRRDPDEPAVPPSDPPFGQPQPTGLEGPAASQADPPPGADPLSEPPAPPVEPPAPGQPSDSREHSPASREPRPAESQPPAPSPGEGWASPQAPSPGPGQPMPGSGFTSGDPLGGSATPGFSHGSPQPPPAVPAPYSGGYTSPPPPGAGGQTFSPAQPGGGTYVLSGWWRRVGAAVIDGIIIVAVALLIMAPLGIGFFSLGENDTAGFFALVGAFLLAMVVIAVVGLAYAPVLMAKTNGQTIGRMATGIRVVRANGERMTFGWAALREVAVKALLINGVGGSFTFGLAGLLDVLWPLWDDENRALHDFIVDTRTVRD